MTHGPAEPASIWDRAVLNFGAPFLTHLLDLASGQPPDAEDRARQEVLNELAAPLNEAHLAPEQRVSWRCSLVARVDPTSELTYLESVRKAVGGRLPPQSGDPLQDAFCRLVYNGLAMERVAGAEWDRFSIAASFQDPILQTPAAAAFLHDPDLTCLFPDAEGNTDERGLIPAASLLTWLPVGGGSTDLRIVVGSVVEQTLARMRFHDVLSEEHVEGYVRESLDQLRAFARGEDVPILVMTGLVGVEVEVPLHRDSWGIRTATGLAIVDHSAAAPLRPRSVLWTWVPHRLLSRERADISEEEVRRVFGTMHQQSVDFHAALTRRLLTLRFAVLAWAVERGLQSMPRVAATASWSMLPLTSSTPPWVEPTVSSGGVVPLSAEDLDAVAEIVDEIGEVTPRLDIALGRMVRVASEQRDAVDALIDAVIAWENMLGTKAETTFKVCAALAWLLEPDDENGRRRLFAEAKKIYALRSALVHGAVEADPNQVPQLGQAALNLAVRAFRCIHADPTLIDLRASARADAILLRAPRNSEQPQH